MSEIKTEGIILKVTPYKDHHRIVQIFTPDSGALSVMAKAVSKPSLQSLLSPLTQLEIVYRKKGTELCFFKEGFAIEHHHFLRDRWDLLEAAGKIAGAILLTQLPGKSAPALYRLLTTSLKQLPHFQEPATLITLFYLKLLIHEGVVSSDLKTHLPLACSQATWDRLQALARTKSFRANYDQMGFKEIAEQLEKQLKSLL